MLVDSHCHLDLISREFAIDDIVNGAKAAGVQKLMTIATSIDNFQEVLNYTQRYKSVYGAIGVHPLNVSRETIGFEALKAYLQHKKIIAIGETGLDYFKNQNTKEQQIASLLVHIKAAQELGMPLVIHTRDADDDLIDILCQNFKKAPFKGVIHCFTASQHLANKMLEIGFYISASGIVTFKNATEIQQVLKNVPQSRLLVETDAPYLAPVPNRGKPNKPEYVAHTAKYLAQLRGEDFTQLCKATTENFNRLFGDV